MKIKTEKLFWKDAYMKSCISKILSIDGCEVVLDRTCFYAFSGGQESDSGTINGIEVVSAVKVDDDTIRYVLSEKPSFKIGDEVDVKIDFEKRFKIMRLHSAAHIVGFLFEKMTNLPMKQIIGSNVENTKSRLDYLLDEPVSKFLPELEKETNDILGKDLVIETCGDENDENRRLWKCNEWICPCAGTHVKSTKEIVKVRLKRKNIGKGKERIEIYLVD